MNEHYLHLLWRTKRLPLHLLKTTDGLPVRILHVGFYNTASGPDFFNGKVEIDGIVHGGNIEMHLRSSDWLAHGHQFDEAYNNVILHVVYEHDELVFIEGIPIPTVELKELIDRDHYDRTVSFREQNAIACANQLDFCPEVVFWDQVQSSTFRRLLRKAEELSLTAKNLANDPRKVLFHSIASAFGMKTNQLPFGEIAHRLPFERIIRADKRQLESMVFGVSGFLEKVTNDEFHRELQLDWKFQRSRLDLHPANVHTWKFKGCRPPGFPTIRLAQFSSFIHSMDWSESFWELPAAEIKTRMEEHLTAAPSDYWREHYDFGKQKKAAPGAAMSLSAAHVVIINSIVPFLGWLSAHLSNPVYMEKAFELLEYLPAEKNAIVDYWKKSGKKAKTAAESQGLLELKNEFCNRKQCLNCKVGIDLLKR